MTPNDIAELRNAFNFIPVGLLERVINKLKDGGQQPEEGIIEALNDWLDKD